MLPVLDGTAGPVQARIGSREAWFGEGYVEAPVDDGAALAVGSVLLGPALVQEPFTVVVVGPDQTLSLDSTGTYVLRRTR